MALSDDSSPMRQLQVSLPSGERALDIAQDAHHEEWYPPIFKEEDDLFLRLLNAKAVFLVVKSLTRTFQLTLAARERLSFTTTDMCRLLRSHGAKVIYALRKKSDEAVDPVIVTGLRRPFSVDMLDSINGTSQFDIVSADWIFDCITAKKLNMKRYFVHLVAPSYHAAKLMKKQGYNEMGFREPTSDPNSIERVLKKAYCFASRIFLRGMAKALLQLITLTPLLSIISLGSIATMVKSASILNLRKSHYGNGASLPFQRRPRGES